MLCSKSLLIPSLIRKRFYSLPENLNIKKTKRKRLKEDDETIELKLKRKREYSKQYRVEHKKETLEREKQYRLNNRLLLRERNRDQYIKKMSFLKNYLPRKKYVFKRKKR